MSFASSKPGWDMASECKETRALSRPGSASRLQNDSSTFRLRVVLLMTSAHLANDLYAGCITPILPVLIQQFGLSLALAGFLVTAREFSGSLVQPFYGFLGDRLGRRWLLGLGPLITVATVGLIGLTPNYAILVLIMLLIGVGSAAFHPQGAALAGEASGDRRGLGMGVFAAGGTLGVALAPLAIVPLVSRWGLRATVLAAIPGLLVGLFLLVSEHRLRLGTVVKHRSLRLDFGGHGRAMALLVVIAVSRTTVVVSLISFLPVLMQERGFTLVGAGAVLSLFLVSSVLASVVGGYLGDLTEPKRVIGLTAIMAIPFLQGALRVNGSLMVAALCLGGVLLEASRSLNTAMAQSLAPENAGIASSFTMGLAFGVGGMGVTLIGRLADAIGLAPALLWLSWLPVLPAALALFLPRWPAMYASSTPNRMS
jgi:FSR family fosmidomycin resistance protein-like MFS transporter